MLFCLRRRKPAAAIPGYKAPALPRPFSIWVYSNLAFILRFRSLGLPVRRIVPVPARAERVPGRPNCPCALRSRSHPTATSGVICRPSRLALDPIRAASRLRTPRGAPRDLSRPLNVPRGSISRADARTPCRYHPRSAAQFRRGTGNMPVTTTAWKAVPP
jgi:hypothetical protein